MSSHKKHIFLALALALVSLSLSTVWKFLGFGVGGGSVDTAITESLINFASRLNYTSTIYQYFYDSNLPFSSGESLLTQITLAILPFGRSLFGTYDEHESELFELLTDGAIGGWAVPPIIENLHFYNSLSIGLMDYLFFTMIILAVVKLYAILLKQDKLLLINIISIILFQESGSSITNALLRIYPIAVFIVIITKRNKINNDLGTSYPPC